MSTQVETADKPPDNRKKVGANVHAKAIAIQSEAECGRLYGSNSKKKMLDGRVVSVDFKLTKGNRKQYLITADYILPSGNLKRKQLYQKNVMNGWVKADGSIDTESFIISRCVRAPPAPAPAAAPPPAPAPAAAPPPVPPEATAAAPDETVVTRPAAAEATANPPSLAMARNLFDDITPDTTPTLPLPTVECHGTKWYNPGSAVINIGDLNEKQWKVTNIFGEDIYPGSGHYMSRLEAWLLLYGRKNFDNFYNLTNAQLLKNKYSEFSYHATR